jgi:hypothetical protein
MLAFKGVLAFKGGGMLASTVRGLLPVAFHWHDRHVVLPACFQAWFQAEPYH